jgi:hypothetical protein
MMRIRETFVNRTEGTRFGETGWYEPWTEDKGELFRSLQHEYGRCESKIYRDIRLPAGRAFVGFGVAAQQYVLEESRPCGWVFVKRDQYENPGHKTGDTYIREVWVEVDES